jgi:3-oxoacyl-[acyl-carrier protein] reductase
MTTAFNRSGAGRVAIVTGGSRGAGLATIGRLAASGFAVVVNYLHDQRAADAAVESILAGNGDAVAVRADVADDLDVTRLFAETTAAFGGIDVVVHAAGGGGAAAAPVTGADPAEFDALVRTGSRATFVVNREAAGHVREHGAIVNLRRAARGPSVEASGLVAATAMTDVLLRPLALELQGRDITVNAVSVQVGRPGAPERVADVIAFLVSDLGHRLTGQVLRDDDFRLRP